MAGIGFELKKLFRKKGLVAGLRAYGYTAMVTTGPMLLGVILLLGIAVLCIWSGASHLERELLNCMITYTLLASLMVTSLLSMAVTRFLSDMLYEERHEEILPSFWGSSGIMLVFGCLCYGIFLIFSGATFLQGLLCLWLFAELIVVWNAMSYLTAIKDYRAIAKSFLSAVLVSFLTGILLLLLGLPKMESLLAAVILGYGVMMIWNVLLLYRYFPDRSGNAFLFLSWLDHLLPLALSGFLVNFGLFSHLVIMWTSPIAVQVKGLFWGAPYHDVPALLAFMTTLITNINFVVSVEVNFYPKYRHYYSLFNDKGSILDIQLGETEMLTVLKNEMKYTGFKQLFATALVLSLGGFILEWLPLGFNDLMKGYFRTLSVGYGLYAVGNVAMLMLLYFTDYTGALISTGLFAICTTLFTILLLPVNQLFYGFGFLLGSAVFFFAAYARLEYFTRRLPYYILSTQPVVSEDRHGLFTRLGRFLDDYLQKEHTT